MAAAKPDKSSKHKDNWTQMKSNRLCREQENNASLSPLTALKQTTTTHKHMGTAPPKTSAFKNQENKTAGSCCFLLPETLRPNSSCFFG